MYSMYVFQYLHIQIQSCLTAVYINIFNFNLYIIVTCRYSQGWKIRGFEGARAPPRRQKHPLDLKKKT